MLQVAAAAAAAAAAAVAAAAAAAHNAAAAPAPAPAGRGNRPILMQLENLVIVQFLYRSGCWCCWGGRLPLLPSHLVQWRVCTQVAAPPLGAVVFLSTELYLCIKMPNANVPSIGQCFIFAMHVEFSFIVTMFCICGCNADVEPLNVGQHHARN